MRLFNTVGPRQTGRYGMVIPRFVSQALAGDPITVYGSGDQTRCFTHVADVVAALAKLMATSEANGGVFNLGSTEEVSINTLAQRVLEKTRSQSEVRHIPFSEAYDESFEDMDRRVPNLSRAHDLIGYSPERSLDDILGDVVAAMRGE